MSSSDTLMIPDVAMNDAQSFELLRVWIARKDQHVSLRSGVWEDPTAWGIMLADLARHIANSFESSDSIKHANIVNRIRAGFDMELNAPTDFPIGG